MSEIAKMYLKIVAISEHTRKSSIPRKFQRNFLDHKIFDFVGFDESLDNFAKAIYTSDIKGDF